MEPARPSAAEAGSPRALLGLSFIVALVLRVVHAVLTQPVMLPRGDNTTFVAIARSVAAGRGGRLPTMAGTDAMSVKFPPLWPWTLGVGERLLWFLPPDTADATWSIVIGASVAPLSGLLAWRLLDRLPLGRRRLIACGTAAAAGAHPLLIGATNSLMSEVLAVPMTLAILLAMDRVQRRGASVGLLVGVGALIGLAALARAEAILLWGAVLAVTALAARTWAVAVVPLAVALVPVLAFSVVASRAADQPVLVATNGASAFAGSNCDVAWSGQAIGHWSEACLDQVWLGRIPEPQRTVIYAHDRLRSSRFPPQLGPSLEARIGDEQRRAAGYAVRRNFGAFSRAIPFRLGRGLGLWWSPDQTRLEVAEGRVMPWEAVGRWFHLLLVLPASALALAGLRRRGPWRRVVDRCADGRRLVPLACALAIWVVGVAVTHGSTRHRSVVDGVFLVLAAVGWSMVALRFARVDAEADTSSPDRSVAPEPALTAP